MGKSNNEIAIKQMKGHRSIAYIFSVPRSVGIVDQKLFSKDTLKLPFHSALDVVINVHRYTDANLSLMSFCSVYPLSLYVYNIIIRSG